MSRGATHTQLPEFAKRARPTGGRGDLVFVPVILRRDAVLDIPNPRLDSAQSFEGERSGKKDRNFDRQL